MAIATLLAFIIAVCKAAIAGIILWYVVEFLPIPERMKRATQLLIALVIILTVLATMLTAQPAAYPAPDPSVDLGHTPSIMRPERR